MTTEDSKEIRPDDAFRYAIEAVSSSIVRTAGAAYGLTYGGAFSVFVPFGLGIGLAGAWALFGKYSSGLRAMATSMVTAAAVSITGLIQYDLGKDENSIQTVRPYKTSLSEGVKILRNGGNESAYMFEGDDKPYTLWSDYKNEKLKEGNSDYEAKKTTLEKSLQAEEDEIFSVDSKGK